MGELIALALLFLAALAVAGVRWGLANFGNLHMEELVYTLSGNLEGTNPALLRSAANDILGPALLVLAAAAALYVKYRKSESMRMMRIDIAWISLVIIAISSSFFLTEVGFWEYMRNQQVESSFIEDNYVDPRTVELSFPEEKRNLVFIFLESMEVTFADPEHGGAKAECVIPELVEIGLEGETFSGEEGVLNGGRSLTGSTYTMGGIFAQFSGLPLMVGNADIEMHGGFLPGFVTLGDILEEQGYRNAFCIGTVAAFASRDRFFQSHGSYELYDYAYSLNHGEISEDYSRSWWGFDDFILYENAKARLRELASSGQPFNFTMLTVDTHSSDGYVCERCPDRFDDQYSNVFACASAQAAEFVRWIQRQDFYENTTIVIVGDHPTMDADYCDDIEPGYERRIYTAYVNAAAETMPAGPDRLYSSMDNFPTTLAALGVKIEGDRLGLGTNLFSGRPTLIEMHGAEEVNDGMSQDKDFIGKALGEAGEERDFDLSFDEGEGLLNVFVARDAGDFEGYAGLTCQVTHKESETVGHYSFEEGEEGYELAVPLEDFGRESGAYEVTVFLRLGDGLKKWYATKTVVA